MGAGTTHGHLLRLTRSLPLFFTSSSSNSCHAFVQSRRASTIVTTPIFYVNAQPHIGHLYTLVLADAYARFQRMLGHEVLLYSGTDEHGAKIQRAATAAGMTPSQHCDQVSASFSRLATEFGIVCNRFTRTSSEKHQASVQHFWGLLESRGHLEKGHYEGWYSVQDESFVPESQTKQEKGPDGQVIRISTESGHRLEWSSEENYMFNLEKFRPQLLSWMKLNTPVYPTNFAPFVEAALREESPNISVSRPVTANNSWGIRVPGDPTQMVYVWLDALVNYLTGGGYPTPSFHWPPSVHVIGKDILKFHAIYWPAFLLGAGLELPQRLLCHSHWMVANRKMSKSLGNVIDPFEVAQELGSTDALRYFLLREGTPHSDGNYEGEKVIRLVNAELADTLGNLLNRCSAPAINPRGIFPTFDGGIQKDLFSGAANTLQRALEDLPDKVAESYEEFNFYRGLESTMNVLRLANGLVQEAKPWEMARNDPDDPSLAALLSIILETVRVAALLISPVVPSISDTILHRLGESGDKSWDSIRPLIWEHHRGERELGPRSGVVFKKIQRRNKA